MIARRRTRQIFVGPVPIGGGAPIAVQSMTNTDTRDVEATIAQVNALQGAGAEIVRLAVVDAAAAAALKEIVKRTSVPLVADIHFDYRLALASLEAGVAMLRINPGNIGSRERTQAVVRACAERRVPIRIGINTGSLEKRLLEKYGGATPEAMVESALDHVALLEDMDFRLIKVSLKASDVPRTIAANRLFSARSDIPLHLGITEAGTLLNGAVRSAVGLGILLHEGIGDTIRVSLTGDPTPEVKVGWEILKSLGLRQRGITITSCPNCGRLEQPIEEVIADIEAAFGKSELRLHLAVMGCSVNGPGESRQADLGVIAARDGFLLYKQGEYWKKVTRDEVVPSVREALAEWPAANHETDKE
ncbi:MAG: flavodoxin-dependent (E)-4-hydroxy-3-methylbut-2-enyl-diphosphate synthase [Myxococcales bacterium]|nr:flavodoxin-dependent (E)-4-hydroxy-3-methylbut-2-enyl-diphosphate synthase [Myxococcales bacterium]